MLSTAREVPDIPQEEQAALLQSYNDCWTFTQNHFPDANIFDSLADHEKLRAESARELEDDGKAKVMSLDEMAREFANTAYVDRFLRLLQEKYDYDVQDTATSETTGKAHADFLSFCEKTLAVLDAGKNFLQRTGGRQSVLSEIESGIQRMKELQKQATESYKQGQQARRNEAKEQERLEQEVAMKEIDDQIDSL